MLSPNPTKMLGQLMPFGILFFLSSLFFFVIESAALEDHAPASATATGPPFSIYAFGALMMTAVGLMVGYLELYVLNGLFARRTLLKKVAYKLAIYLVEIHLVVVVTFPIATAIELGTFPFTELVGNKLALYLLSRTHLSTCLQLGVTIALAVFYAQIGQHIGLTTLLNYLTGKYHTPREEARIFLFADMTSSTAIAERLGHLRYFDLLREYYADLSRAIGRYSGEIHEYVGDEVVVSWPYREGIHADNCLRCFFAMRANLQEKEDTYRLRFGVAPAFKAALHGGRVTTGEIGVAKKQIVFTGDVLNATARMLALCSDYHTDLLLSDSILQELSQGAGRRATALGSRSLRGKLDPVTLYTIVEAPPVHSPVSSRELYPQPA